MGMMSDEYRLLFAKADDLYARARKGAVAATGFLTPAEAHYLEKYAKENKMAHSLIFFGGYKGATRTKGFFLPDYILDMADGETGEEREKLILSYIAENVSEELTALRITGSGYRALSHRDYLGSLLSLGIERFVIGDIATPDEYEAIVFVGAKIAGYILQTLTKIASDDVKCEIAEIDENFSVPENVEDMVISVASLRADCIVGALAKCSRTDAQSLVRGGAVSVNYEEIEDPDKRIGAVSLVSIRGEGKFRILDDGTETRRGRLRVKVQKFK